jgi:hypothetical protein
MNISISDPSSAGLRDESRAHGDIYLDRLTSVTTARYTAGQLEITVSGRNRDEREELS